jgi:hypothetical protein
MPGWIPDPEESSTVTTSSLPVEGGSGMVLKRAPVTPRARAGAKSSDFSAIQMLAGFF